MYNAKSTVKRLLSVLLCVVMIMALAPLSGFADGEEVVPSPSPTPATGDQYTAYVTIDFGDHQQQEQYVVNKFVTEGELVYLDESQLPSVDTTGYVFDAGRSKKEGNLWLDGNSESGYRFAVSFTLAYNSTAPAHPDFVNVYYVYENMAVPAESVQVRYGSSYTPKSDYKVIDGYKFSGWTLDTAGADLSNLTADVTFKGSYSEDPNGGKYYVEHYLQNLDGSYSVARKTLITGAANGKQPSYNGSQALSFPGFKFERADNAGAVANIYVEQSSPMKLYYARNSYTVTYMVDGKQSGKTETYKFGESVTVRTAPDAKKGYTFVGWDADVALGSGSTMPASNVTFSGSMVAGDGVKYTVNIYRENDAGKYELYESSERTGVVGKLTTVKAPKVEGYKAKAFTNKTIAADGSTVVNVYYDLIDTPYVPVRPSTGNNKPNNGAPVGTVDLVGDHVAQLPGEDELPAVDAQEPDVSVENPEVTDIGDAETPLAENAGGSGMSIIPYIIIGIALVLAAVVVYIKNKKLYNT